MAKSGPVVRVDRGDGHLFNMKEGEFKEYLAANPGARMLGPRPVHGDHEITPQEIAATKAQEQASEGDGELGKLKKDELVALAEERGIDSSGTKADILERLNTPAEE